ncbi:hypothetical protein RhiLY_04820 [Ceratobasidium sp. AG-Ba]|nr:hypothetical protein RhiLY_04820 [Ceratobasidium sp. AG-Ba]
MIISFMDPISFHHIVLIAKSMNVVPVNRGSLLACWSNCAEAAGLSGCPPELAVLEYMLIWFKKKRSNCREPTTRRADPLLEVRLRIDCVEISLIEPFESRKLIRTLFKSRMGKPRTNAMKMLSMKSGVDLVRNYLVEHSQDQEALSTWRKKRTELLESCCAEVTSTVAALKKVNED